MRALEETVRGSGLEQITVVAGDPLKTNFPDGSCDALFMRNVYHHFEDPVAMGRSIAQALKPGARLAVADFAPRRGKEASRPADRDDDGAHGVSPETVAREMREAGLEAVSSETGDDREFMVVLSRPGR